MAEEVTRIAWVLETIDKASGPYLAADRKIRQAQLSMEKALRSSSAAASTASTKVGEGARSQAKSLSMAERAARDQARVVKSLANAERELGRAFGVASAGAGRSATAQARAATSVAASADKTVAAQRRMTTAARNAAVPPARGALQEPGLRRASERAGRGVGRVGSMLAVGAGLGLAASVRGLGDYEAKMDAVAATSGATGKQLKQMDDLAMKLGADTKFSAGQAADAMFGLSKAGFTAKQAMKVLPGTMSLAAATGIDLADATDTQAVALRAFGLESGKANMVADLLTKTVNTSAVDMQDLGLALPYVSAAAKSTGTSLQEVTAMAGLLGNAGIDGEKFGTAIRAAMLGLTNPSNKARDALRSIGVDSKDLAGIPLPQAIGKIAGGLDKLKTRGEKVGLVAQVFGREAAPAVLTLLEQGEKKIDAHTRALSDSEGQAKRTSKVMQDNLKGDLEQLGGSLETAKIKLEKDFGPALRTVTKNATAGVNWLGKHEKTTAALGIAAAGAVTGLAGLAIIAKVTQWSKTARGGLSALRSSMGWMSRSKAGQNLVNDLSSQTSGMGGRLSRNARAARAPYVATMRTTGVRAGASLAANTAETAATQMPASMNARSGKFRTAGRSAGKVAGRAFGLAVVGAVVLVVPQITAELKKQFDAVAGEFLDDLPGVGRIRKNVRKSGFNDLTDKFTPKFLRMPRGNHGGVIRPGGFRRYQDGGLVDAMVSPGENVEYEGATWRVPGSPVSADTVHARLPPGAAVITGHGQQLRAAGASIEETIAQQMPHFAKGGRVPPASAWGFFRGKAFTPAQSAGWLGNIQQESGFNPGAVQPGGPGRGLVQWGGGRFAALQAYAAGRRKPWQDGGMQLDFIMRELRGPESAAMRAIKAARTVPAATDAIGKRYERYGHEGSRQSFARAAYERFSKRDPRGSGLGSRRGSAGMQESTERIVARGPLGRSRTRAGLLEDAFGQGVSLGQAGISRAAIRQSGSPIVAATRAALTRDMFQRTVQVQQRREPRTIRSSARASGARGTAGGFRAGGGWGGTQNLVMQAISGINQRKSYKRNVAVNGNQNSDHNTWIKNAFAADLSPGGDSVFQKISRRLGIAARKGSWNNFPNRPVRGVRSQLLWHAPDGSHTDHVHLGIRRMRRGGVVPGRALTKATTAARSNAGGSLEALDRTLGDAVSIRIGALRRQIDREVKKGGSRRQILRLQQVLDVIDGELGRRVGMAERIVGRNAGGRDRYQAALDRGLRRADLDSESVKGIASQRLVTEGAIGGMRADKTTLQRALKNAQRAGSREKAAELREQITNLGEEIEEATTKRVELARDYLRAIARSMQSAAQERVDASQFGLDSVNASLAFTDASQRVSGTADTQSGLAQKAAQLQASLIPALAGVRDSFLAQAQVAAGTGDVAGLRQALLSATSATTDMANASADAAEAIKASAEAGIGARLDSSQFGASFAQASLDLLANDQRLAGSFDTGGGARADYISNTILPALRQVVADDLAAVEVERQVRGDGSKEHRDALLRLLGDQKAVQDAQLQAQEEIKSNTDSLRELGGSTAFDSNGQRFTDLISLGVGV